jgi:hypothetical protein
MLVWLEPTTHTKVEQMAKASHTWENNHAVRASDPKVTMIFSPMVNAAFLVRHWTFCLTVLNPSLP